MQDAGIHSGKDDPKTGYIGIGGLVWMSVRYAGFCVGLALFLALAIISPVIAEEIILPDMGYSPTRTVDAPSRESYSPPPASSYAVAENDNKYVYKIGPNDVLAIQVWQSPDLNREVTVRFDGRITFPLAGELVVEGMTVTDISNELSERLREFIRRPQVTVTVKEFHSQQVLVLGKVGRAGIYPLKGPMKILELLTAAGMALDGDADITKITVIRASGEALSVNLEAFLYRQDIPQNIYLKAGDNIFVPGKPAIDAAVGAGKDPIFFQPSSTTAPQDGPPAIVEPLTTDIMVLGEVGLPGAFSFPRESDIKVWQVLLRAGGLGSDAYLRGVKVIRSDKIQEPVDLTKLIFDGDLSQDLPLFHGDVLYIPKRKSMRVYIIGAGRGGSGGTVLENLPATTDLLQLMARVGVDHFEKALSNVRIIRGWPNSPKVLRANVDALIHRGNLEENIPLQDNDVVFFPNTLLTNVLDIVNRVLSPISGAVSEAKDFASDDASN